MKKSVIFKITAVLCLLAVFTVSCNPLKFIESLKSTEDTAETELTSIASEIITETTSEEPTTEATSRATETTADTSDETTEDVSETTESTAEISAEKTATTPNIYSQEYIISLNLQKSEWYFGASQYFYCELAKILYADFSVYDISADSYCLSNYDIIKGAVGQNCVFVSYGDIKFKSDASIPELEKDEEGFYVTNMKIVGVEKDNICYLSAVLPFDTKFEIYEQAYDIIKNDSRFNSNMYEKLQTQISDGVKEINIDLMKNHNYERLYSQFNSTRLINLNDYGDKIYMNGMNNYVDTWRNSIYYCDGETGLTSMLIEGVDSSEIDIKYARAVMRLSDTKFAYTIGGWEWLAGSGIYDISTFTDYRLNFGYPYKLIGDKLYSTDGGGYMGNFSLCVTDIDTCESKQLFLSLISQISDTVLTFTLSEDGKYAAFMVRKDNYENVVDLYEIYVCDLQTEQLIKEFTIKSVCANLEGLSFDNNKLYAYGFEGNFTLDYSLYDRFMYEIKFIQ